MAQLQQDFGMSLLSLLATLLLEQVRPLSYGELVQKPLSRLADFLQHRFDAGERRNGLIGWLLGVGVLMLFSTGLHFLLSDLSPLPGWLWTVLVLSAAMRYRHCGHYYTGIQLARRADDVTQARNLLLLTGFRCGPPLPASPSLAISRMRWAAGVCRPTNGPRMT